MSWVKIGNLKQIPQDTGLRVDVADHRVALFRIGTDVYALGDRCSHAEASLAEGEVFDKEVECPRHGSAFDLMTGEPNALPATDPVPVYDVRVDDGTVYLQIGEEQS